MNIRKRHFRYFTETYIGTMIKKSIVFCFVFMLTSVYALSGFAAEKDDILGPWITEGGDSCVEIFEQDGVYFAKITAVREPFYEAGEVEGMDGKMRIDLNNPDESLRSQPLVGLELMKNFRFDGSKWKDGRIYDPDNGKTYRCKLTFQKGGILKVRGFIGVSLIGRTTTWMRPEIYIEKSSESLAFECPCAEGDMQAAK